MCNKFHFSALTLLGPWTASLSASHVDIIQVLGVSARPIPHPQLAQSSLPTECLFHSGLTSVINLAEGDSPNLSHLTPPREKKVQGTDDYEDHISHLHLLQSFICFDHHVPWYWTNMAGATSQTPEEKPCVTILCIGALWGITDFQAPAPAPPKSSSFLSQRLLLSLPNGTLWRAWVFSLTFSKHPARRP